MGWTDERVTILKQLWGEGKTAAEIAKELGEGVSRNAVIGKAHRLKLSSRMSSGQQNNKPKKRKTDKVVRPPQRSRTKPVPVFKGKELQLKDLRDKMCRWPNGDPQNPQEFSFCGETTIDGKPYCEAHCQIAYHNTTRMSELNEKSFAIDSGAPVEFDIKSANG